MIVTSEKYQQERSRRVESEFLDYNYVVTGFHIKKQGILFSNVIAMLI